MVHEFTVSLFPCVCMCMLVWPLITLIIIGTNCGLSAMPLYAYCLLSCVVRSLFDVPVVVSSYLTYPPVFLDLNSVPEFFWITIVDYSFWKFL